MENNDAELLKKAQDLGIDVSPYLKDSGPKQGATKQKSVVRQVGLVPADVDQYDNPDESFFDAMTSRVGAFNQGFEKIPSTMKYHLDSTAASLLNSIGVINDKQLESVSKEYKQDYMKDLLNNEDAQKHPGLTYGTSQIGALGAEMLPVGMAAKGIGAVASAPAAIQKMMQASGGAGQAARIGAGVVSDVGQAGALSALGADSGNKTEAFVGSMGPTAFVSGGARIAGEAIQSGLLAGRSVDQVSNIIKSQDQVSKDTGISQTLGQRTRNESLQQVEQAYREVPLFGTNKKLNTQYDQTVEAINKSLVNIGTSLTQGSIPGAGNTSANRVANAFDKAKAWHMEKGSQQYHKVFKDANILTTPEEAIYKAMALEEKLKELPQGALKTNLKELLTKVQNLENKTPLSIFNVRYSLDKAMHKFESAAATTDFKNADLAENTLNMIYSLRTTLENGLHKAAKESGKGPEYLAAKNYWKQNVLSLTTSGVEMSSKGNQVSSLLNLLANPSKTGVANRILNSIGPEGQAAVRTHLATKAVEQAVNKNGNFDVGTFMQNYQKGLNMHHLKSSAQDAKVLNGIKNIMSQTAGVGIKKKIPNLLGGIGGGAVLGGSAVYNPAAAITVGALAKTLSMLSTTESGQRLILAAARIPVGSKKSQMIINTLGSLAKQVGLGAGAVVGQELAQPNANNPQGGQ